MKAKLKKLKGFTLVEMAIVLVIIGVILGAVSIGKDMQRDAEYAKIYQKFVAAWKTSYDQYYNRYGVVLGDSQVAPTYMVDGAEASIGGSSATPATSGGAAGNLSGAEAGIPANFDGTGNKVCHGQGYAEGDVGSGDADLSSQDMHVLFDKAGLRMPPGRTEGQEDRYLYLDSNGNPAELQICFQWNPAKTNSGSGNVMVIRGLTPDLARALDQMIDGKPDATEGRFRQQDALLNDASGANQTSQQPGEEWRANNTFDISETSTATSDGSGDNQDENRIVLLTAHWVMDQ